MCDAIFKVRVVVALFAVASTAAAQQSNTPQATLLVDGASGAGGALLRPRGANLSFTLTGTPGQPLVLAEGTPIAPVPLPAFGGQIDGAPYAVHLNGFDPAHALFGSSRLGGTGALTWNGAFDPPPGVTTVVFQGAVGDPTGTPSGLRLTGSTTVQLVALPNVPAFAPRVTRGPYLEQTGSTSSLVTVRLDQSSALTVELGTDGATWPLNFASAAATLHTILLSGLAPATRYRYRVKSGVEVLCDGPSFAFRTAPPTGSSTPFRFVAWGDSGNGTPKQILVSQRLEELEPRPDFALILGDIIYPGGEAIYYDDNFFLPYRGMLASMSIWPAYGNHDAATAAGAGYFDAFHLPTSSPGGEKYYSFDWGNAHFTCLDTQSSLSASDPMLAWLAADLAATARPWKVVFFHHPPYTGGTHADNATVQSLIVPLLDAGGVDLVLSGHSHVLERSYLLANHAAVQNDPHDYSKTATPTGAVYAVAGAGGQVGSLDNDPAHPLMAFQLGDTLGHAVIEIEGANLRGYFLDDQGEPHDRFSITKGPDATAPAAVRARPGASPSQLIVVFDEPVEAGGGAGGAENAANYLLDGATPALAASLGADTRTVVLTFAAVPYGVAHAVHVAGVRDRATPPNAITPAVLSVADEPWRRVVLPGGHWHVYAAPSAPPVGWEERDFDDASWTPAWAPIGYGGNYFPPGSPGLVLTGMINVYPTFYARADFVLDDPASVAGVRLEARFDDGFVAYLNGAEIARRGVPAGQNHATLARSHSAAADWEGFHVPQAARFLLPGTNVLAFELHNTTLSSGDAYLDAALALRGPSFAPGIRLTANGAAGDDHGAVATVSVAAGLSIAAEAGPSGASRPTQFSISAGLRPSLGLGAALLAPELPLVDVFASPAGVAAFSIAPLPPSLIGLRFATQAFQSAPFAASEAITVTLVP
jgi:hypothetical protein